MLGNNSPCCTMAFVYRPWSSYDLHLTFHILISLECHGFLFATLMSKRIIITKVLYKLLVEPYPWIQLHRNNGHRQNHARCDFDSSGFLLEKSPQLSGLYSTRVWQNKLTRVSHSWIRISFAACCVLPATNLSKSHPLASRELGQSMLFQAPLPHNVHPS